MSGNKLSITVGQQVVLIDGGMAEVVQVYSNGDARVMDAGMNVGFVKNLMIAEAR